MSGFTSTPYDWVRQFPKELKELDEIPLWGKSPPFPWDSYSNILKDALKLESCQISPIETGWQEPADIINRINENPFSLTFALNPLKGHCYVLFAHSELEKLLRLLLHGNENVMLEKEFIYGFSHFLGLELADALQKTGYEKSFVPQVLNKDELPEEPCLCIDIKARIDGQEVHGMLCITNQLRASIKEYYVKKERSVPVELYNTIEVTLQLVAGSTTLPTREWNASTPGDFLILDSCSLIPGAEKSRIMLTLNDLPIFRGKIKEGSIKILEYPQLHEVETPMSPKDFEDEESDFDESTDAESDFDEESEEYTEDESMEHTDEDEYSDEDYSDLEEEEEHEEESEYEDEESEASLADVKAPSAPIKAAAAPATAVKEPAQAAAAPATKVTGLAQPKQAPIKPEDIPITITVEVGRLQMTIQKLMELEPGNVLELDVHPENGVDLVVRGKCIGKGELLRIGDVLGVRILDKI